MTHTVSPCVKDEGLYSYIPASPVFVKTFVEAYHRLGGDLEVLRTGFSLESWQVYATMAYYCANKELFDAEYERVKERQRKFWEEVAANQDARLAWSELRGAWPGDETDEEINAWLERIS